MQAAMTDIQAVPDDRPAYWGGVFAMSLCVFALIASEFMPVSLLTPIAADFGVTEGQAGHSIAISGAFAVLSSLFLLSVVGSIDRKTLLLALTLIMAVSGIIVARAPTYEIFMFGRALIGIVIGGFWSMSASVAMRLVPKHQVARALAIFNGGNAVAMVIAPPLGSFLGGLVGWRGTFLCLVPIAVVALIWQALSLPSLEARRAARPMDAFRLLRRPIALLGMASVGLFFAGQFALFTYIRPFLEGVTQVNVTMLSLVLFVIGAAGIIGTSLIGAFLKTRVYATLIVIPVVMALIALGLIAVGSSLPLTAALMGFWAMIATAAPVGWWTWLARSLPNDAEAGGGLMVAVIQLSITLGATIGGILFDGWGYQSAFVASAVILMFAAVMAAVTSRSAAA